MEWRDEALIIGVRRHGETSAIVELFTPQRGRHLGLVRGGRSRRMQPLLQLGNSVDVHWYARIDEHLGTYTLEITRARAALIMESAAGLHGVQWLCHLLRLTPERESHPALSETALLVAENLHIPEIAAPLMARFELGLLSELGFGLALDICAVTETTENLTHVSPKTGRAVCADAAAPYLDRLLPLPRFLVEAGATADAQSIEQAFNLTGFFLERNIFGPRGLDLPDARLNFIRTTTTLKSIG